MGYMGGAIYVYIYMYIGVHTRMMEKNMETTISDLGFRKHSCLHMSIGQNSLHPVMDAGMGGVASSCSHRFTGLGSNPHKDSTRLKI